jgi:hypothetical protein
LTRLLSDALLQLAAAAWNFASTQLLSFANFELSGIDSAGAERCTNSIRVFASSGPKGNVHDAEIVATMTAICDEFEA